MFKHHNDFIVLILTVCDILAVVFSSVIGLSIIRTLMNPASDATGVLLPAVMAMLPVAGYAYGAYCPSRKISAMKDAAHAAVTAAGSALVFFAAVSAGLYSAAVVAVCVFSGIFGVRRGLRIVLGVLRRAGYIRILTLVVGWKEETEEFLAGLNCCHQWEVFPVASFSPGSENARPGLATIETTDELKTYLRNNPVDIALACDRSGLSREIATSLEICADAGAEIYVNGELKDFGRLPLKSKNIYSVPVFAAVAPHCANSIVKSLLDLAASSILLVVLSPLLLLIALAIKLTSPGAPVLYKQERVGMHGRRFHIYKFRTMVPNADKLQKEIMAKNVAHAPLFKVHNDPRITPVGRLLRRFGMDELPQLLNVLKGDMSIVGPRPYFAREAEQFPVEKIGRQAARPGITGLGQVRGGSELPFEALIAHDEEYIENWSVALDLSIAFRTVPFIMLQGTVK